MILTVARRAALSRTFPAALLDGPLSRGGRRGWGRRRGAGRAAIVVEIDDAPALALHAARGVIGGLAIEKFPGFADVRGQGLRGGIVGVQRLARAAGVALRLFAL